MRRVTYYGRGRPRRNKATIIAACIVSFVVVITIAFTIVLGTEKGSGNSGAVAEEAAKAEYQLDAQSKTLDDIEINSIIEEQDAHIAAHYPRTTNDAVNQKIKDFANNAIAEFRTELLPQKNGEKDEFSLKFEVFRFDKNIVSFLFSQYSHHIGDAHGVEQIHAMTFNLSDGNQYDLPSILKSDNSLGQLSKLIYDGLVSQPAYQSDTEKEYLKTGTEPTAENFANFALDSENLIVFFQEYQVGTRTNPTSLYKIPLTEMKALLSEKLFQQMEDAQSEVPSVPAAPSAPTPSTPSAVTASEEDEEQVASATEFTDEELQGKKLIALTFDDGPHESQTPRLLDILKKENVKVTFFALGSRVQYYPEISKRAVDEGHQVASHTMNHLDLTKLSAAKMKSEIDKASDIITAATGVTPTAMRPPYGASNNAVKKKAGTPLIMWDVDPEDWKNLNAGTVTKNIVSKTKDGDIILLHDIHETSVDAVTKIIRKLKAKDFTFVTVDQLIRVRDGEPVNGEKYFNLPPEG